MAKISIVVPVYNAEKTIDRCMNSLIKQTLSDIEIICIDDNSSDSSYDILKKYAENDKRVVIYKNDSNSGTFMARKKGVALSSGEYIMFADNDDWYEIDACKSLYENIKDKKTDILVYGARGISESDAISPEEVEQYNRKVIPKEEHYSGSNCILAGNKPDRLWNKIILADICRKAYCNSEDIRLTHAEDTYAAWLIASYAKSMAAVKNIYYNHSMGDGITTSSMTVQNFENLCQCRKACEEAIGRHIMNREMPSDIVDFFEKNKKGWTGYCINAFHNKVKDEHKAKALEILIKYYGMERIAEAIERKWNGLEKDINKAINNKKRKTSILYKIGRKIRKLF